MALPIRIQAQTRRGKRHFETDRRQGVLQLATLTYMHVYIPAGHQRQAAVHA